MPQQDDFRHSYRRNGLTTSWGNIKLITKGVTNFVENLASKLKKEMNFFFI
jgi:hypothetical protein